MEVAVSIIYYIPYNGINLNWTAITGNNGILMEIWNYFDYFYSFGIINYKSGIISITSIASVLR